MIINWFWLLLMGVLIVIAESLSTGMLEDVATADQAMKPKVKRAQEILMFGNQQNRRVDNSAASNILQPTAEKRTLRTSGLEDVKAALADEETFNHQNQQNTPPIFDRDDNSYDKNFLYGKVMVNEENENIPRNNWDLPPPYSRYYDISDDRRKRSEKIVYNSPSSSVTILPTTLSPPATSGSQIPVVRTTSRPLIEAKRSPPVYPELRYKRAPDREDLLALLSLWENSPRNRNWRNYANDEYDNVEDDGRMGNVEMMGIDDEEPRNSASWLDSPIYSPHHYNFGPDIPPSEIGIPRTHPINVYDQYSSQYAPPYETPQYGAAQYGSLYPQHHYYPFEKRFMVSRKRAQGYDSYNDRNINDVINFSQMMNSQPQGYPNYPQRILY
ncbi:hypothetical protein PV328_008557 [Microctonus aethiopoides]|uniref:Prohormone-2 n=1 Tax=Microctonus aethiopoides TaxID=144406 RepID=A0AA39FJS9_9HYME|nr:hypothetical protein PV328_008557 [Microctonus aethiopoides]